MLTDARRPHTLTHFMAPNGATADSSPKSRALPLLFAATLFSLSCAGAAVYFVEGLGEWATGGRDGLELAQLRGTTDGSGGSDQAARATVERRMAELRRRQELLTSRQTRITELLQDAKARDIVVTSEAIAAKRRQPLSFARLDGRVIAAPRPVPAADEKLAVEVAAHPAVRRAAELDLALLGLERTQDAIIAALENAMESRIETLARIPAELGLDAPTDGVGGPAVELRGLDAPLRPTDPFEVFHAALGQIDQLKQMVDALPVRSPLVGKLRVTSSYGRRRDPFLGRPAMHTGIDLAAARGTAVHATASGKVTFAGWNGGYGRMIEIDHGNGHKTRYGHLSKIKVAEGDSIDPGQIIGAVGSSGRSTGPHLHYEMVQNGRRKNPATYLDLAALLDGSA